VGAAVGEGMVRGHTVSFSPAAREKPPALAAWLPSAGSICRGEVRDLTSAMIST